MSEEKKKIGLPIAEAIEQLKEERVEEKVDKVDFMGENFFINNKALTKEAEHSLVRTLAIPDKFLKNCVDDSLVKGIMGYCCGDAIKGIQAITYQGAVTNILSKDNAYLPMHKVLESVSKFVPDARIEAMVRNTSARIITNRPFHPPKDVNDISYGGLSIDINYPKYFVDGFIYRLICTNGMLTSDTFRTVVKENTRNTFTTDLGRNINSALEYVHSKFLPAFMNSSEKEIKDIYPFLHYMARENGISPALEDEIVDMLPTFKSPISYYDLINLITSMGRDRLQANDEVGYKFERFGGVITESIDANRCSHCGVHL